MALSPFAPLAVGNSSRLGITAPTIVKATPGVLHTVIEVVAGSSAGAVYDSNSLTGNSAANQVLPIPNPGPTSEIYTVSFPCMVGIVVVPGTGQTLAVSYT